MEFIDLKKQYELYKDEIDAAIHRVLDHGRYIMGPEIQELEDLLADFVGVKHAISVSSGTDSLLMALMALGVGPGDEVITTPFTWIATSEVIGLVGAKPVFVDIDPKTYNVEPEKVEAAITSKTKAILPVSLFGQMADHIALEEISCRHGIPVIEDGAQSFGASQNGKKSGSVSTIGSTSFFPAKPFGCYGDGGMIFTDDDQLTDQMRAIRTHGGKKRHHHPYLGMNARLDTMQAAILLAKFPHFESEIAARSRIGARYTEHLKECCQTPDILDGNTHVYAQYTIRVPNRDELALALKEKGIPTAVYYPKCLHEQPVFASLGYAFGSLPEAEKASREVLSLPMHPWLSEDEQDEIIAALKEQLLAKV